MYTPVNQCFTYIKVGFKEVKLKRHVFVIGNYIEGDSVLWLNFASFMANCIDTSRRHCLKIIFKRPFSGTIGINGLKWFIYKCPYSLQEIALKIKEKLLQHFFSLSFFIDVFIRTISIVSIILTAWALLHLHCPCFFFLSFFFTFHLYSWFCLFISDLFLPLLTLFQTFPNIMKDSSYG